MSYQDLISFAVVYLAPIVPALLVFIYLKPEQIVAEAGGTLLGITIKSGGGVAGYLVFMVMALVIFNSVSVRPDKTGKIYVELSGTKSAVDRLKASASELSLLLTPTEQGLKPFRIGNFASLNEGMTLVANPELNSESLGHVYTAALSPEIQSIRYTITGPGKNGGKSDSGFLLTKETTLDVRLSVLTDDPLVIDDEIFHGNDWTESLLLTSLSFDKLPDQKNERIKKAIERNPDIKASETVNSLLVFMNDGSTELGEIALTGYYNENNTDASPTLIEAISRKITSDDNVALSLRLAKSKNLFAQDGNVIFTNLSDIISSYKTAGSEIGFVRVNHAEKDEITQGGELELRGTELRVGPLKHAVKPEEGIAIIVKFVYDFYWEPIKLDITDNLTQRLPFPTRLWFVCIRVPGGDISFNPVSLATDFTMRDHSHQSDLPNLQKKISDRYLAIQAGVINKEATGKFSWRWNASSEETEAH